MSENCVCNKPYVSCIKINGVPILPPLITAERRLEIQHIKQQAILVEQQLKNRNVLKTKLDEILCYRPLSNRSPSDLTDVNNSHVEDLGIDEPNICKKTINLTRDVIDVTQYDDNGIKMISNDVDEESLADSCGTCTEIKLNKPRLIRSNSYTLETPSPMLLAHLKKQTSEQGPIKHLSSCRNWSSFDNNYTPFDQSELKGNESQGDQTSVTSSSPSNKPDYNVEIQPEAVEEVVDVIVEKIVVNSPITKDDMIWNDGPVLNNTNGIDPQLLKILEKIPDGYSKEIISFMQKQREEHQKRFEGYEKLKQQLLGDLPMNFSATKTTSDPRNNSCMSMSSQSLYFSTETLTTPTLKLIDLETEQDSVRSNKVNELDESRGSVNRELFPKIDSAMMEQLRKEWAASVIGAYVKGYLTRRLLKTLRVQTLIETIKDALMCALQLHAAENIDEADVELHRRLIQQVSAACYAFHDIFFSLPPREQMIIISSDRQRLIDRANRPASAPSARRSSTSFKSSNQMHSSVIQSQSLPKV